MEFLVVTIAQRREVQAILVVRACEASCARELALGRGHHVKLCHTLSTTVRRHLLRPKSGIPTSLVTVLQDIYRVPLLRTSERSYPHCVFVGIAIKRHD